MCPRGDIFFMEVKKATTYREQVEKIEQRGCCIENVDEAIRCLAYIITASSLISCRLEKQMGPTMPEQAFQGLYRYMSLTAC